MELRKKNKVQKTHTRKKYEGLVAGKWSLFTAKYVMPLIPASVLIGINHEEWFRQDKTSVGMGFAMLMITVITSVLGISKKDKIIESKISTGFFLFFVFLLLGISFGLLGDVIKELGIMFTYTSLGVLGSACCDQLNQSCVLPEIDNMKRRMENAGMAVGSDRKAKREEKELERIRRDAELEEKNRGMY